MTATAMAPKRRLISIKELANRLGGVSVRTVERLYEAQTPGLPAIIRLNKLRMVDEAQVDRFVERVARERSLPAAESATPPRSARRVRRKA